MKRILIAMTCIIPLCGFAEWKHLDSDNKDVEDKEFVIPKTKTKKGFEIVALGGNPFQLITFRYLNGYVDYCISLYGSNTNDGDVIYMDILDDDRYKICSHRIQKVAANFSGQIRGSFKCSWDEFSNYKYFHMYIRT